MYTYKGDLHFDQALLDYPSKWYPTQMVVYLDAKEPEPAPPQPQAAPGKRLIEWMGQSWEVD